MRKPKLSNRTRGTSLRLAWAAGCLLAAGSAAAATITVTGTGDTVAADRLVTLRAAITSLHHRPHVNAPRPRVGSLRPAGRGFCQTPGPDPLYPANEGKAVPVLPPAPADAALAGLRSHPLGTDAVISGAVRAEDPGEVTMRTIFGGTRVVDMLVGEQLPRIC